MTKREAVKATKNGAIAALISGFLTLSVVTLAILSDSQDTLLYWNDPIFFFDGVLIIACAYGIYRKSRMASVLLVLYFLISKLIISVETQASPNILVSLIFLYFFGKAVYGSFVYHRLKKQEDPTYKPATKWSYIIGIPGSLIVLLLIAFAFMTTTGIMPSTRVLAGEEVKEEDFQTLVDNQIIFDDDTIEYIYFGGISSIIEQGSILVQDRVIVYFNDENFGLEVYELYIMEIQEVVQENSGGSFSESVYLLSTDDSEKWMKLFLSTEQNGDENFIKALKHKVNS